MPEKGTNNEGEKLILRYFPGALDKASPAAGICSWTALLHKPIHFLFLLKPIWVGFQLICHLIDIK